MSERVDKASLPLNQPRRTPSHPTKSHIVKTKVDGKEKILRFGEQGASTAGKPKAGESERMKAKRASFKARHARNIAKGQSSPAYWANKVKWAEGGVVSLDQLNEKYADGGSVDPSMLRRLKNTLGSAASDVNRSFYENVSGPAVGSLVDMTVGLGDLAQMGAKYLGNRMGYDAGEFTPVAPRVKQALGVDNYNPYTVGGVAANLLPFARGEQALSAAATGLPRLFPNLGREAAAYGGSEAAAAGAREFMPDSPLVELAASAAGGLGASASRSPTVSNMAVKNKGGNWLDKSVAEEIKPLQAQVRGPSAVRRLREIEEAYAQNVEAGVPVDDAFMQRVREQTMPDIAINRWLDTKLNKYIRNEMGTPEDPVRALAERGTLHFEPLQRGPQVIEELRQIREMEGLPGAALGQSELARRWETATDTSIQPGQARRYLNTRNREGVLTTETYPWLLKVPPETTVYHLAARNNMGTLGFNHLVDELRNATRPGTDLPERLRIDYNKLDRMTVPQIVEKVADINTWRAAQEVEASQRLANNAATTVFKEYPEQGLKWVALRQSEELPDIGDMLVQNQGKYSIVEPGEKAGWKDPSSGRVLFDTPEAAADAYGKSKNYRSLAEALKYEGDTMGHCVGGYCPEVSSGETKIFSLRDEKGQPHVTIEVRPSRDKDKYYTDWVGSQPESVQDEITAAAIEYRLANPGLSYGLSFNKVMKDRIGEIPDNIIQIKGKGNAKPAEKYLPAVQDFIKSGTWGNVGDLRNTGLIDARAYFNGILPGRSAFMTEAEFNAYQDELSGGSTPAEGFAKGGAVRKKSYAQGGTVRAYDPQQIENIMSSINAPRNYASGGSVLAYDPGRVDAILNQFRGAV